MPQTTKTTTTTTCQFGRRRCMAMRAWDLTCPVMLLSMLLLLLLFLLVIAFRGPGSLRLLTDADLCQWLINYLKAGA
jgi:hypothetical protein